MGLIRKISFVLIAILVLLISPGFARAQQNYIGEDEIVIDGIRYKNVKTEFQKKSGESTENTGQPFPNLDGQTITPTVVCEDPSETMCYSIGIPGTAIGEPVYGEVFGESNLWQKVDMNGQIYYAPIDNFYNPPEIPEETSDIYWNNLPVNTYNSILDSYKNSTYSYKTPSEMYAEMNKDQMRQQNLLENMTEEEKRETYSMMFSAIPGLGDTYDFISSISGKDPIGAKDLTGTERIVNLLGSLPFLTKQSLAPPVDAAIQGGQIVLPKLIDSNSDDGWIDNIWNGLTTFHENGMNAVTNVVGAVHQFGKDVGTAIGKTVLGAAGQVDEQAMGFFNSDHGLLNIPVTGTRYTYLFGKGVISTAIGDTAQGLFNIYADPVGTLTGLGKIAEMAITDKGTGLPTGAIFPPLIGWNLAQNLGPTIINGVSGFINESFSSPDKLAENSGKVVGFVGPFLVGAGEVNVATKGAGVTKIVTIAEKASDIEKASEAVNIIKTVDKTADITTVPLKIVKEEKVIKISPYELKPTEIPNSDRVAQVQGWIEKFGFSKGESIKYYEYLKEKYIMNGHHRQAAAKNLNIDVYAKKIDINYLKTFWKDKTITENDVIKKIQDFYKK